MSRETDGLIKQVGNSGYTCRCRAYMYANVYEDRVDIICPQCGENYTIRDTPELTGEGKE